MTHNSMLDGEYGIFEGRLEVQSTPSLENHVRRDPKVKLDVEETKTGWVKKDKRPSDIFKLGV